MIHILWEYSVRQERRAEFEEAYGGSGAWVRFFRQDPAYRGTILARDPEDPDRYLTVDAWDSRRTYEEFARRHAEEYRAIDARCEAFTREEKRLGLFEAV